MLVNLPLSLISQPRKLDVILAVPPPSPPSFTCKILLIFIHITVLKSEAFPSTPYASANFRLSSSHSWTTALVPPLQGRPTSASLHLEAIGFALKWKLNCASCLFKNSQFCPGQGLSWLEHSPNTLRLWVQSLVRATTRINQQMHK